MKSRGNRERMVVLDKGCHPYGSPRMTGADIESDLSTDLDRMVTTYADIWMFHRDEPGADLPGVMRYLHEQVVAGRIRSLGASNWSPARIDEANQIAKSEGLTEISINSPNLCLADSNEPMWAGCVALDEAGKAWHTANQMPVFAWSSVARGFFAGFEDDDVRRVFHNEVNFERRARTETLAAKLGVKPVQIALAWTLAQPFPVHALIGCRTPAEVDDAVGALNITLTEADRRWLEFGDV